MKKNVGSIDRGIRVMAGLVVIGIGVYYQNWWGLLGLLPLLTATIGWCPAYLPFGLSTCKPETQPK